MTRRYIRHSNRPPNNDELKNIRQDILTALLHYIARVQKHISASSDGKVYIGVAGGIVMNQYLSSLPNPTLHPSLSPAHLLAISDTYLTKALALTAWRDAPRSPSHSSFLETTVGIATLVLLRVISSESESHRASDAVPFADVWPSCVRFLHNASLTAVQDDQTHPDVDSSDSGCEVLYGRAGLLYALLRLRKSLPSAESSHPPSSPVTSAAQPLVSDTVIQAHVDSIIHRGKIGSRAYAADVHSDDRQHVPALMWTWHGKRYLGAAHGVAGILQILLSCPWNAVAPHISLILDTVEWLAGLQDSSGNWPTKAPSHLTSQQQQENDLVQWCHGAPGILILFSTLIRRSFPSADNPTAIPLSPALHEALLTSLHRGASLVYRHGFLRKGTGLCHGVAGSVYALLAVSDACARQCPGASHHPQTYFLQAAHLAHLASSSESLCGEMVVPDRPWSLYEGVAGMCCAWGEVAGRLGSSEGWGERGLPGFDDVG